MSVRFKWKHNVKKARRRVEGVPALRELDSRGKAARSDSGKEGAVEDARVTGARRIRGVSGTRRIRGVSGVLSCDEGRNKGENGESGESEHGVGVVCKGQMELEGGSVSKSNTQGNLQGSGVIFKGRLCLRNKISKYTFDS